MSGVEVLFFCLGAAVGFAAYACLGWDRYPGRRTAEILTPRCAWIILAVTAGTLIAVAYVVFVTALPGEPVYKAEVLLRAFFVEVFLGFAFGLGFGIWVNYFFVPNALAGAHARAVHLRWGIALLLLLLTGVLIGPTSRLLPRLTGISTPAVSLDFAKPVWEVHQFENIVVAAPQQKKPSATASLFLNNFNAFLKRDKDYVLLLHGEPSPELLALQKTAKVVVAPIAECFADMVKEAAYDSGVLRAEFGQMIATSSSLLRSVLAADEGNITQTATTAFAKLNLVLPDCPSFHPLSEEAIFHPLATKKPYILPYLALTVAHMLELAGYRRSGAELLAQWIDRSLQKDLAKTVLDWHRIRAYLHLSLLVEDEGDVLVTHDVLQKNVRLFKGMLVENPNPELRHWDRWAKNCVKCKKTRCPQSRGGTETDESISRIHFAFMAQRNRLIRHALYSDQVTAALLPYAESNTAVPKTCYPRLPGGPAYYRAGFLTTHGGLLMALAARAHFIAPEGGQDLEPYRDARSYLLQALALLRPLEMEESEQHLRTTAAGAMKPHPVRQEVTETERYLTRAERALNIR